MRNFVIGSADLRTQCFPLSEPRHDEFPVRPSPPAKVTGSSVPLGTPKISSRVSPLRPPLRDFRLGRLPQARGTNAPPSIDPAKQSTLVASLVPHDESKQPNTSVPFSQTPLMAATAVPLCQDCPRIDLVAFVREKQKAKKLQKKKLSAPPLQKEQRRRVIPQDSSYEKFR